MLDELFTYHLFKSCIKTVNKLNSQMKVENVENLYELFAKLYTIFSFTEIRL